MAKAQTIAILGAGSWGTAVAVHLAHSGHRVLLWGRALQHVQLMQAHRCNARYLPDITFPASLEPVNHLDECMEADYVIIAVPSHAFSALLKKLNPPKHGLAWLTKGIDPLSHRLLSELVSDYWGSDYPVAMITGPSFAKEVAEFYPTAITLASNDSSFQQQIFSLLHQGNLRVYLSQDLIGVQICGAVKNILAIACGISDGLGYGANAKSALITRGLAEMRRLGCALHAREDTFLGLAGVGDLVLTCTDNQSRNRRFGLLLGHGFSIQKAEDAVNQVVEGKFNAAQVNQLAEQYQIDMPICFQVNALLNNIISPEQAVNNLMSRLARNE